MDIWVLVALVMLSEALLHYFPWKLLLKGKELHRLGNYVLGVLGLMLPFTAWLCTHREYEIMQVLWIAVCSGGLVVMALYGLDHYLNLEMKVKEEEEREALRRKQDAQES